LSGERPRSRPYFHGDDWHELRDAQYDDRWEDLAMMVGRVSDMYRRASVVMGREDDPVAEALRAGPYFDGRSLTVAHAHLAAFWRLRNGHVNPSLPGLLDLEPLLAEWRRWVIDEVTLWIIHRPILVRRAALVTTRSLVQRTGTILAEAELWESLKEFYPLPPPDHPELFDGRGAWPPDR
jgi:hypothetical protein